MTTKSAEQDLLDAIFGGAETSKIVCTDCGKTVDNPIYYNNQPYHAKHLPGARRKRSKRK